ncbi:ATP-dependent Clp protease proteolytic subunit [Agrobacterium fabrum]|uniref:SDH family Clp fold serine proteinase n=1 Tax=Agrobacterium fabrum TaxID=1176649 RepID=UPI00157245C0|nr:ATP-dependent Clp protease proteolytic subunit [Agrobacterium fabrum]NTB08222.1 serine dehydrogenasease [Agrobacterium fabrum]
MADIEPASSDVTATNRYIDVEIVERLKRIEEIYDADVITCIHPIQQPIDDMIRRQMDELPNKRENLLVILETDGGSIETTERIADVFRHHYKGEVSFLIPNFAMSAGTILVMSGDRILMDYYSILGPIDPQVPNSAGELVPGMGYIEKFKELVDKSKKGSLSAAELAFLLDKFDPARLHWLEQAREHGVDLLKKWLVQYKFKNWSRTSSRNLAVNEAMKTKRAKEIADKLNNTKLWRSHGRGLSMDVVRNTLNLVVEDYGTDPVHDELNKRVTAYYRLLKDYMGRRGWDIVVQTRQNRFMI